MNQRSRSWCTAKDGAAAAEAALIMAVLLLLVAGSIEFARALWTNNTMLLAVEEAGRYAMVHNQAVPAACGAQVRRRPRIALRCPRPRSLIALPGRPSRSCRPTRPPVSGFPSVRTQHQLPVR